MQANYLRSLLVKNIVLVIAFAVMTISAFYSLTVGSYESGFEMMRLLFVQHDETAWYLVQELRAPRVISSLLVGSALAVSGAIMQNILRNPLASPFTLGISHGAAFGATLAITAFGAGTLTYAGVGAKFVDSGSIAVFAFLGSLVSSALILALSALRRSAPEFIALSGIAIGAFFGALTMLLQYFATDFQLAATVFWSFGDLGRAGYSEIYIVAALCLPAIAVLCLLGWSFNAMLLGDIEAKSLGVNAGALRIGSILLATVLASSATAYYGIIGFVGLIAPHIGRIFVGEDYRYLTPLSAMLGATLLTISDIASRTVLAPTILPVGILTAMLGAPLFLYLATFSKKRSSHART